MHHFKFKNSFAPLLLATVTFISHYCYFRSFGFYEDDWAFFVPPFVLSHELIFEKIIGFFAGMTQGRPIGFAIALAGGTLGATLDGLPGIYLLGYLFLIVNVIAFYYFLRQIMPGKAALIGALCFVLFAADTTKAFLTHALIIQPALTFLIVASLCYIKEKRLLSYIIVTGALLTYETAYLPFYGLPLLNYGFNKNGIKKSLIHATILTIILISVVCLRTYLGESRIGELAGNPTWRMIRLLIGIGIGPFVMMGLSLVRPITAILGVNAASAAVIIIVTFIIFIYLFWQKNEYSTSDVSIQRIVQLGATGLFLTFLSYGLAFNNFPLYCLAGRSTSIHVAGSFGFSIFLASLAMIIIMWGEKNQKQTCALLGISLYLGLLAGFHVNVQQEFKQNWLYQGGFWQEVLKLCPDATENTIVIVEDAGGIRKFKYALPHSWTDFIILDSLFRYPAEWANYPKLYVMDGNWESSLKKENNQIMCKVQEGSLIWIPLPPNNLIVLKASKQGLGRATGTIQLLGQEFPLKKESQGSANQFEKTRIFNSLIKTSTTLDPGYPG